MQALGQVDDPQVGLRLLRSCAGHCKLTHSIRCSPLFGNTDGLQAFDTLVRDCFSGLTGLHPTDVQWEQVARDLAHAGLGLRSVVRDAPAAYLASVGGCAQACRELDPCYAPNGLASEPDVLLAATSFSALLEQPIAAHLALGMKQKALTSLADAASWNRHLSASTVAARALLRSEAEQGARAWLAAVPAATTRMEGAAFVMELQRRLGMPDALADTWCPKCDGIMDRFSLHAGTCAAGGERTQRHNALRNLLASWADRAGLQPEVEKASLLLPQRPDEARLSQRRPADIFLPSLSGGPAALDLAVTAPQRQESLAQAGQQALAAASHYAAVKSTYLQTSHTCAALRAPGSRDYWGLGAGCFQNLAAPLTCCRCPHGVRCRALACGPAPGAVRPSSQPPCACRAPPPGGGICPDWAALSSVCTSSPPCVFPPVPAYPSVPCLLAPCSWARRLPCS